MRMRLRQKTACVFALTMLLTVGIGAQGQTQVEPDDTTLRWVQRAVAWYPDSTFELIENKRFQTTAGSYRLVRIDRKCASQMLSGQPSALVDEVTNSVWLGSVGELPVVRAGASTDEIKTFVAGFLPEALSASMGLKAKVVWDVGPRRPGALIPMDLMVQTGYGEYRRPAAVTADGKYLVMATEMSRDEDPVAARKRRFANSKYVIWDTEKKGDSKVEIVEFSDLECPACKSKWPLVEEVLAKNSATVRHGMVSFPLTMIHPWAFRAASASWCVAQQNPQSLIPFKETFYSLQREMEVSLVTETSVDFVAGQGLDESAFRGCYLRESSLEAVHKQMGLGQLMGVRATPTYFVNGWQIQVPDASWFPAFVADLAAGKEPK